MYRYATLFTLAGIGLALTAIRHGGFARLALWPALNLVAVGTAYAQVSPWVFGKQPDGVRHPASRVFMAPFQLYMGAVAWGLRTFSSEPAVHQVTPTLWIGRRLLSHELPEGVTSVADLTCEFSEPASLRGVPHYHNLAILDATAPPLEKLQAFVHTLQSTPGVLYVHCAQGHGRTGLVTACLLLSRDPSLSPEDALTTLTSVRPALECNAVQLQCLQAFHRAHQESLAESIH